MKVSGSDIIESQWTEHGLFEIREIYYADYNCDLYQSGLTVHDCSCNKKLNHTGVYCGKRNNDNKKKKK